MNFFSMIYLRILSKIIVARQSLCPAPRPPSARSTAEDPKAWKLTLRSFALFGQVIAEAEAAHLVPPQNLY